MWAATKSLVAVVVYPAQRARRFPGSRQRIFFQPEVLLDRSAERMKISASQIRDFTNHEFAKLVQTIYSQRQSVKVEASLCRSSFGAAPIRLRD
jgi:seryl-tRNA synthetase